MTLTPVATEPVMGELAGHSVVLAYTTIAAEYDALRTRAALFDHSHRGRMRFTGDKAAEVLGGLVTNDVQALEPGHGQYAAALSAKGRVVADARIFRDAEGLLVDVPARAAPGFAEMVRKYVNPRLAKYRDAGGELRALGIHGAQARNVVAAITGGSAAGLGTLPAYHHVSAEIEGAPVLVAHVPDLGVDGFELYAAAGQAERIRERALAEGAIAAGLHAWEVARVEAGRPEWGLDMDETTLAQEANLEALHAISYTKGCYIGQEVVARIHFRGHVNKHLRGLRVAGIDAPPSGAELLDAAGAVVGDVRSSVVSPRLGGIALGMVRREVEPGSSLVARLGATEARVDVTALPFAG